MVALRRFILCCMMVLLPLQGYSAVMKSACHSAGAAGTHCHEADAAPQAAADHDCHHQDHGATPEKHPSNHACADSLCCHLSSAPAMALPALPTFVAGNTYDLFPFHPHPSHIPDQPQRPPLA